MFNLGKSFQQEKAVKKKKELLKHKKNIYISVRIQQSGIQKTSVFRLF
jgi:hypothetical protein